MSVCVVIFWCKMCFTFFTFLATLQCVQLVCISLLVSCQGSHASCKAWNFETDLRHQNKIGAIFKPRAPPAVIVAVVNRGAEQPPSHQNRNMISHHFTTSKTFFICLNHFFHFCLVFRPSATSCRIGLMESHLCCHHCHGGPPPLAGYPPQSCM